MAEKEKKQAISKREALDANGKDVSNYTEAVKAKYTFLASGKSVEWDVSHIDSPVDRALCIEGFLNKAGHAINKAVNSKTGDGDADSALDEFASNLAEGGWTNREGGTEVNLGAVLEAFAKLKKTTVDAVREAWSTYDDETKTRIRTNPHVKAAIAAARAEKAAAIAAKADAGAELPDL